METMEYVVKFDVEGKGVLKDKYNEKDEEYFVMCYSAWANECNKHIEKWNQETEELGLEPQGPDDFESDYFKYMLAKHRETLARMIEAKEFGMVTNDFILSHEWYIGDELDFHMKWESKLLGSYVDVTFHLERG